MSAARGGSPLGRAFAAFEGTLWTLFLVWSGVVAAFWTTGWSAEQVFWLMPSPEMRAAFAWLLQALDPIWLTLGAVNVYLALVRAEGLDTARRWSLLALAAGVVISAASALTGWPLGSVHYPSNLGLKLGPVPSALPMLWLLIVAGARDLAQAVLPRASHGATAILAGVFALLTDVNLEPLAWKWRTWWIWYPEGFPVPSHPPLQNFAAWLCAGAALAYMMRSPHVLPRLPRRPFEPIAALAVLNAVCLLTHGVLFLRR